MARRQRRRRLRRQSNDRRSHGQTHRVHLPTSSRQIRIRRSFTLYKRQSLGVIRNPSRKAKTRRQSRQLNTVLSRVGVVSQPAHTLKPLQAQPSIQSRKEHKCIKKPSSERAHSGSGAYRNQWKPWCKGK